MAVDLNFDFGINNIDIDLTLPEDPEFDAGFGEVQVVTTSDHTKLANRDAPNQHPVSAIEGLEDELEARVEGTTITNEEINEIFNLALGI